MTTGEKIMDREQRAELLRGEIEQAAIAVRVAIDLCRTPATAAVFKAVGAWVSVVSRAVEAFVSDDA